MSILVRLHLGLGNVYVILQGEFVNTGDRCSCNACAQPKHV